MKEENVLKSSYVATEPNFMRIKFFKRNGYKNGWELNFIGKTYSLRIARYQFALWKNYDNIFSFNW